MADYTPTTEQVRDVYHLGLLDAGPSVDVEAALAQFDRWLAAHERGIRADQIERDAAITERLSDYYRSAKYAATIRAQLDEYGKGEK